MNQLTIAAIRKSCVFVLQIEKPADTLRKLATFFADRHIEIRHLQFYNLGNGDADVIIHCQIEKDRIARTIQLLEQVSGIEKMEMLK